MCRSRTGIGTIYRAEAKIKHRDGADDHTDQENVACLFSHDLGENAVCGYKKKNETGKIGKTDFAEKRGKQVRMDLGKTERMLSRKGHGERM